MARVLPGNPPSIRQRLRTALLFVGALLFLFEEWLWVGFTRLFGWLGRLGLLRWLDRRLVRLAPAAALAILCVPVVLLFPVKIAGFWMIASGRFLTGCAVMLAAKIVSTAIVARIFLTCRGQLMQMSWFARLYNLACALRGRVHQWLAMQAAWQDARRFAAAGRRLMHRLTGWRGPEGRGVRKGVLRRWRRSRRKAAMATSPIRSGSIDDGR
jgi:hypothetical protein